MNRHLPVESRIRSALEAAHLDVVVPGLNDSGPQHWQTHWCARFPSWRRIGQRRWDIPDLESWMEAIERSLATSQRPAILVGHSFGALASATAALRHSEAIAGVLLVAPADPARFDIETGVPNGPLGLPSRIAASRNDPWLRYEWAAIWAARWACPLVDFGLAGHINAESGHGLWPQGLELLAGLIDDAASFDTAPGTRTVPPPRKTGRHLFSSSRNMS